MFLRNRANGIASIDLFVVSTISFKLLSSHKASTNSTSIVNSRPPGRKTAGG